VRPRAGLADALLKLGDDEAAISHYRDMLKLNPGDNQGIRHVLLACLLRRGDLLQPRIRARGSRRVGNGRTRVVIGQTIQAHQAHKPIRGRHARPSAKRPGDALMKETYRARQSAG
jgi:hypothetical protein